ncbi:MAG: hypothetical protein LBM26_01135 [Methanobrevibacter sp.]|jgi:DNA repair exonuclease SbcCD ATPase subunit|nr:hypothetical protein [Methanobrevibacter sp.]
MEALEFLAIIILIIAIVILLYYYINNINPNTMNKLRNQMSSIAPNSNEAEKMPGGRLNMNQNSENSSMGEKIKVKFKDIDMPSFNTDSFSKKIDAFLDNKSEELIKDWSLATKDDISVLEKRWEIANMNLESLEKRFNEYRDYTNERIDSVNERLSKLEENK